MLNHTRSRLVSQNIHNAYSLKVLCLYRLGQNCLHFTFKPYLGSETYSRRYEKLSRIVLHTCKNITETMILLKRCGPRIRLCLFTFRPIASKQLNNLTTIVTLSWLGVQRLRIRFGCKRSLVQFCFVVVVLLPFLSQNTLLVTKVCNLFCNIFYYT